MGADIGVGCSASEGMRADLRCHVANEVALPLRAHEGLLADDAFQAHARRVVGNLGPVRESRRQSRATTRNRLRVISLLLRLSFGLCASLRLRLCRGKNESAKAPQIPLKIDFQHCPRALEIAHEMDAAGPDAIKCDAPRESYEPASSAELYLCCTPTSWRILSTGQIQAARCALLSQGDVRVGSAGRRPARMDARSRIIGGVPLHRASWRRAFRTAPARFDETA